MNPEVFSEWLKRQGHQVIKSKSSYWCNLAPHVFQAFPYHWVIEPEEEELSSFIRQNQAIGLRYSTPVKSRFGQISYHAVYDKPSYDYPDLGKWARKNVKKGLSNCVVEQITFQKLAKEGFDLQIDTLNRQGRKLSLTRKGWEIRCLAAKDLPGFQAWGAYVNNDLAASVITFEMEESGYMLYQQSKREYLEKAVNNALGFTATQYLLSQPNIKSILYGLHSLDAPASVDEFKFRMGYYPKPVRQRVEFNPILTSITNKFMYSALRFLHYLSPGSTSLAKAEGMVRFNLQGKLPLSNQDWPDVLEEQKLSITHIDSLP